MKESKFSKNLFYIAILTVITILTWIGFDVYRAFNKVEIPKNVQEQLTPLNPQVDMETLENLPKRLQIKEEEFILPTPTSTPTKTPTLMPTPTPTIEEAESGTPTITETEGM
jgi:hypothetical protein